MGRMYGRGKGISKSSIPYKRKAPRWLLVDSTSVVSQIEQLARKGNFKAIKTSSYFEYRI